MPGSSQQLLQALDSTLNAELDCSKGPLFHGSRNPDVRVMLLESSEENPQLTWTWTYSLLPTPRLPPMNCGSSGVAGSTAQASTQERKDVSIPHTSKGTQEINMGC